jgi:nicotinate-nucleotide adenylyltransferase
MQQRYRIGLYGGTFDPLHNAHLNLARWTTRELQLDFLYFIPASRHAFKSDSEITSSEIRLEMISRTIANSDRFRVSRIEIDKEDISYTIDTLQLLRDIEPFKNARLFQIIGADNLNDFHLWKDPSAIFKFADVAVLNRPGYDFSRISLEFREKMIFLDSPQMDISSTKVRERRRAGKSISRLVPKQVLSIIRQYRLYV